MTTMAIDNKDKKVLNVPHLRFSEFTEEWERKRFKDVCNITTGNKNTQDKSDDGIYPFYVRSQIVERINSWTFDGEAILTAGDGVGVGKVFHYSTGKIGVHQRVYILSDFKCDGKYLYSYFAGNFYNRVKRMSAKNSVDSVRMEMIADMPISLPSNEEQKKIGHLLALLDERIATQNKIIDKLQSLISGLNDFLHLQVGGLSTSFKELGTSYSGLSGKSGDDFGKGKPYITYLNIYSNSIVNEEQVDYVIIGDNEKQNTLLYGDLLFTLSSETPDEVGIGAVYLGESDKYYLNSFCFGLHMTAANKVYSPYLAYLVSNSIFRKFIYPLAQGSTRFNLQKNDFMKKKFLLPTFENQKEIARTLNALSSKLETERKLLLNYQEQKQYLLGAMFI